jgi:hypothetical protein
MTGRGSRAMTPMGKNFLKKVMRTFVRLQIRKKTYECLGQ